MRPLLVHVALVAFVAAQVGLGVLHVLHFRDAEAIIRHTVETTPRNARARMWLAERRFQREIVSARIPASFSSLIISMISWRSIR